MSGHSKWATIKRAKGVTDAKRSKIFTKLAKAVSVAARDGADPTMNSRLRLAIDRARASSMPKENIDRAIQKGAGTGEGVKLEEVRYEAYGPGKVAFLIDAVTDNKNRSSSQIRHLVEHYGGRMAEIGSVGWMFDTKGLVQVPLPPKLDEVELALIEAGAEDINEHEGELVIICQPADLEKVKLALNGQGLAPSYANIEPLAKTTVTVEDANITNKLNELREALDEDEDVTNLYDNEA